MTKPRFKYPGCRRRHLKLLELSCLKDVGQYKRDITILFLLEAVME